MVVGWLSDSMFLFNWLFECMMGLIKVYGLVVLVCMFMILLVICCEVVLIV